MGFSVPATVLRIALTAGLILTTLLAGCSGNVQTSTPNPTATAMTTPTAMTKATAGSHLRGAICPVKAKLQALASETGKQSLSKIDFKDVRARASDVSEQARQAYEALTQPPQDWPTPTSKDVQITADAELNLVYWAQAVAEAANRRDQMDQLELWPSESPTELKAINQLRTRLGLPKASAETRTCRFDSAAAIRALPSATPPPDNPPPENPAPENPAPDYSVPDYSVPDNSVPASESLDCQFAEIDLESASSNYESTKSDSEAQIRDLEIQRREALAAGEFGEAALIANEIGNLEADIDQALADLNEAKAAQRKACT